jgi:hypothetical protein
MERARRLGFPSDAARRRAPRTLRKLADFRLLPEAARESRSRALSVVHQSRVFELWVEEAAAISGVRMWEVRYWAGEALQPSRRGHTLPREADRILRLRPLVVEGQDELVFVPIRGSRAADRADHVFDVQWRFVTGKADESELDTIRGIRIGGKTVKSDPDRLTYLGRLNALDTVEAYRETIG